LETPVCLDSAFDDDPGICVDFATVEALCEVEPMCWQQCPMGGSETGSSSTG
jgi:hypothetical protein